MGRHNNNDGQGRRTYLRKKRRATMEELNAVLGNGGVGQRFEVGILDFGHLVGKATTAFFPSYGKNKRDMLPQPEAKTIFVTAKDGDKAKKKAESFGAVQFCRKVDVSYFLNKIEHLNLNQKPLVIELAVEQHFELNKDMEITSPPSNEVKGVELGVDRE